MYYLYKDHFLKIVKVNENFNPKFGHQHYDFNARSTLAKSMCLDKYFIDIGINEDNIKSFKLNNLQRINIIIKLNKALRNLIEFLFH